VTTATEPTQQVRFRFAQFRIRDADLLKAQFVPPCLDVDGESKEIDFAISRSVHEGLSYT
jgi:hypothetical protein